MFKYADDTYVVIPASNIQSRDNELDHVAEWALANNLRLNRSKCVEVVFTDGTAGANFRFATRLQFRTFSVLRQSKYSV